MKKLLVTLLLCLALVFSIGSYTLAVEAAASNEQVSAANNVGAAKSASDSLAVADGPYYLVNGTAVSDPGMTVYNQVTYVNLQVVVNALYPSAPVVWENNQAVAYADNLTISARPGDVYVQANGRYLYVPHGVRTTQNGVLVPIRTMAQILNGYVVWDQSSGVTALFTGSSALIPGDQYYNATDLKWLSQIINAESGSEPFNGKLAVGTVIMNRIVSPQFPNSVYDVVFDRRGGVYQFTPVANRSVYKTPNPDSVIAAKLVLEGARLGGDSMYFVNLRSSPNCWASRNRPYVDTIGRHTFYG